MKNKVIVDERLKEFGINEIDLNNNKENFKKLIYTLKYEDGISIRQISVLIGINRGIIQRMV